MGRGGDQPGTLLSGRRRRAGGAARLLADVENGTDPASLLKGLRELGRNPTSRLRQAVTGRLIDEATSGGDADERALLIQRADRFLIVDLAIGVAQRNKPYEHVLAETQASLAAGMLTMSEQEWGPRCRGLFEGWVSRRAFADPDTDDHFQMLSFSRVTDRLVDIASHDEQPPYGFEYAGQMLFTQVAKTSEQSWWGRGRASEGGKAHNFAEYRAAVRSDLGLANTASLPSNVFQADPNPLERWPGALSFRGSQTSDVLIEDIRSCLVTVNAEQVIAAASERLGGLPQLADLILKQDLQLDGRARADLIKEATHPEALQGAFLAHHEAAVAQKFGAVRMAEMARRLGDDLGPAFPEVL